MQWLDFLSLVGSLAVTATAGGEAVFKRPDAAKQRWLQRHQTPQHAPNYNSHRSLHSRQSNNTSPYLNSNSRRFVVDGTALPNVTFDVGESYAGLLPISNAPNETRQLYFWFFPSSNPDATNEIAIWLNGGPGCSSLNGFLTENGPFLWQPGTLAPTTNPYTFINLTNYVWIDQPIGAGFSQGTPNITNEIELAEEFKGFWRNFVDLFQIQNRDTYITGESYGGFYVPYIANSFLEENNTEYFNLKGISVNDPIIGDSTLQQELPVVPYINYWSNVFGLNDTFVSEIQSYNDRCGYTDYYATYFQFPPPASPWPSVPNSSVPGCDVFDSIMDAVLEVNPCFNVYHIFDTCPHLYSEIGNANPGYLPPGAIAYFDRTDVQNAINAPVGYSWQRCASRSVFAGPTREDQSLGPALDGTLANVIDKTQNAIIGSGALDFLLETNGTLFALQNTTWGGVQGFQTRPSTPFYVPYHPEYNQGALAGAGLLGTYGVERGLTFYEVQLAGHQDPFYAAGAAYRVIELLLGRVPDLSDTSDFTTQSGVYTGNGTFF